MFLADVIVFDFQSRIFFLFFLLTGIVFELMNIYNCNCDRDVDICDITTNRDLT